jgi:hypothetical protein
MSVPLSLAEDEDALTPPHNRRCNLPMPVSLPLSPHSHMHSYSLDLDRLLGRLPALQSPPCPQSSPDFPSSRSCSTRPSASGGSRSLPWTRSHSPTASRTDERPCRSSGNERVVVDLSAGGNSDALIYRRCCRTRARWNENRHARGLEVRRWEEGGRGGR